MHGSVLLSHIGIHNRPRLQWIICVLLLVSTPWAWADSAATAPANLPLEHVTLQLKWYHQFQFAGYYAAVEKGFFREAGLDVTLKEATPALQPDTAVTSGQAQYGVGGADILISRNQGARIVALAAVFQHSPMALLVLKSSGIQSPQDLRGKRVMTTPPADPEIISMLHNEGITEDQLTIVPKTWDIDRLARGDVDALSAYVTNEPFLMQQRGIAVNLVSPLNYDIDFYSDCLFTSEREVAEHPERVRAFVSATQRGWTYAMSHKEEIADLIISRYNPRKSREHLLFEANAMDRLILPKLVEIGHMNPWRWRQMGEQYVKLGLLQPDFTLDGFFFTPPQPFGIRHLRQLAIGGGVAVSAAVLLGGMLISFNRRLQHAVHTQTTQLRDNATQLKIAADAAKSAGAAKDRFLAALSHELRTPLTPVLAMLSSLDDDACVPEGLREDIAMMRRNVDLEARLIDDLLDLTRITHGRLALQTQSVDVHDLVRLALSISQQDAQSKQQHVQVNLAARHHRIEADPARLQQVFWNIIKNAIRYTPSGGAITIQSCDEPPADDGTGHIVVSVTDTGVGISPETLPLVFDAFTRNLTASHSQGLGMGMTIARSVVQLHKGSISAHSDGVGKGTTFRVSFSVLPDLPAPSEEPARPVTAGPGRPLRILLVEDHPATLAVMRRLLGRMGHTVLTADSVLSAVEKGKAGDFDLLLSDLGLPDGTGHDVLSALRQNGQFKAIALSGYGMESDIQRSRDCGFADHLVKPVDINRLRRAIETVCGTTPAPL